MDPSKALKSRGSEAMGCHFPLSSSICPLPLDSHEKKCWRQVRFVEDPERVMFSKWRVVNVVQPWAFRQHRLKEVTGDCIFQGYLTVACFLSPEACKTCANSSQARHNKMQVNTSLLKKASMSLCTGTVWVWPLPPHAPTKFFEKLCISSYS